MDLERKMHLQIASRSEGDGMESVSAVEAGLNKKWTSKLPSSYHGHPQAKPKEPKFVPYEPYKAAVSPLTTRKSNLNDTLIDTDKVNSLASSIIKLYSDLESKEHENMSSGMKNKAQSDLVQRVAELESENKELKSQYQLQVEVNADLKRLLVASLGEEAEQRVACAARDRAQLGREVARLSEEEETLSARSQLWESKFKASSVMVKELVQLKDSLSRSVAHAHKIVEDLLQERRFVSGELCAALSDLETACRTVVAAPSLTVPELANSVRKLSGHIRLQKSGKPGETSKQKAIRPSPAENKAVEFLRSVRGVPGSSCNMSQQQETCPGVVACRLLPHSCEGSAPTGFCRHCSGRVKEL